MSAAKSRGLGTVDGPLRSPAEAKSAVSDMISRGADAIVGVSDNLTFLHRAEIMVMAREARLPTVFPVRELCDAGALICYSGNLKAMFKRSAAYLDRVLRGANPADLPMEQPSTYEFVVNMRTAQALGLALPESLLVRADHII